MSCRPIRTCIVHVIHKVTSEWRVWWLRTNEIIGSLWPGRWWVLLATNNAVPQRKCHTHWQCLNVRQSKSYTGTCQNVIWMQHYITNVYEKLNFSILDRKEKYWGEQSICYMYIEQIWTVSLYPSKLNPTATHAATVTHLPLPDTEPLSPTAKTRTPESCVHVCRGRCS